MSEIEVKVQSSKIDPVGKDAEGNDIPWSYETKYDFGGNVQGAVALAGEATVYDLYEAKAKIQLQDGIRKLGEAGKSTEEIDDFVKTWTPGTTVKLGGDPREGAKRYLEKLDPAERKAFLKELAELAKAS